MVGKEGKHITAPLIFKFGADTEVGRKSHCPVALLSAKGAGPIVQETAWTPGLA